MLHSSMNGESSSALLLLKAEQKFENSQAHTAFIDSLAATYGLQGVKPEELRWADVKPTGSIQMPPRIQVSITDRLPNFGTSVVAVDGDTLVSSPHYAALFFRDVAPLSMRKDLKKYEVVKRRGVLNEQDEALEDGPTTLDKLIARMREEGHAIPETTNIVEMVSVLPIAPNGEFRTEFYPTVQIPLLGGDFSFPHFVQDGFLYASLVSGFGRLDLLDLRQDNSTHRFKAEYVPTMDSIERLFVPDSAGHMIVLALPVNVKHDYDIIKYSNGRDQYNYGDRFGGFGLRSLGDSPMMKGGPDRIGPNRSAEIGRVNIERGSKTDIQTLETDVTPDPNRTAAIYHVLFIGMKPDTHVDAAALTQVGRALDFYKGVK